MNKGVVRNKTLIGELDYKILNYFNKNDSGCITDLIKKFKSGSQHLIKRLNHLKGHKLILSEKEKGRRINYSINNNKKTEVRMILEVFNKGSKLKQKEKEEK